MSTVTYEEAIAGAAQVLADARAHMATLTAEEAAREAYVPGGPTIAELVAQVRELRARTAARMATQTRKAS